MELQELAEHYYELVWRHYMFQVSCVTREDYDQLQKLVPTFQNETYEEHMSKVTQGIPHDVQVMVAHIKSFLEKYVEFQEPEYAITIERMTEAMRNDKENYKLKALEHLKELNASVDATKTQEQHPMLNQHPPIFETFIGPAHFVLPTYCNPLMTCLYSLLFGCFQQFSKMESKNNYASQ